MNHRPSEMLNGLIVMKAEQSWCTNNLSVPPTGGVVTIPGTLNGAEPSLVQQSPTGN